MPTPVVLPKQGNSVESCLITSWKKQPGDRVHAGEVLVEVETDKALFTVESTANGTLLERFFEEGDDVPVLTNIAVIGEQGDDVDTFRPQIAPESSSRITSGHVEKPTRPVSPSSDSQNNGDTRHISPRALHLAQTNGLDYTELMGTGPEGRIIERDVQAALHHRPRTTRATRTATKLPPTGTGIGGRVSLADLTQARAEPSLSVFEQGPHPEPVEVIPLRGIRARTAERMYQSLQQTAQLTLNTSADATAMLAYRQRLKTRDDLRHISINALVLYAVTRTLPRFQALNATFDGEIIHQYSAVHLGFAVDLPHGLIVPVIRHANKLSLTALAAEADRLVEACQNGKVAPDELQGGTFTVSNLGGLGIETFTPILNPPQVAILGVGTTTLKPVMRGESVKHLPHLNLSLTIDHQALDGAPAARFLQVLADNIANIDLVLAT